MSVLSLQSGGGQTFCLYHCCSRSPGLTEVTEQEKLHVPALQLSISPHGVAWLWHYKKILFSAVVFCYGPSPDWTCAHRTIPEHLGCLPAPDARSMSPLPLPLHDEVCRVSFPGTQKSCILHTLLTKASRCYCNSNNN